MGFNRMDELIEPLVALPDRFDTRLAVVLQGSKVTELKIRTISYSTCVASLYAPFAALGLTWPNGGHTG
jgi:hypothetical protein